MDLNYSEDQVALGDLVRSICEDHCTSDVVRAMENDPRGYPEALWQQFTEAGLLGTLIPEQFGGNPVPMLVNAAIYEQLGRALAPTPHFVSSVVATLALLRCDAAAHRERLLPAIATGSCLVIPAWLEPGSGYAPRGVQTAAQPCGDGWVLNGEKRHVFFASSADQLLVLARTGDGDTAIDLFLVPRDAPGVTLQQERSMAADTQYRVRLKDVAVAADARLTRDGDGWPLWQSILQEAVILDAARSVGLAERALEITVAYAKEREQFGKPIGAFQAIGHYLADCATEVEGARTLVYEAAWAHSNDKPYATLAAMAQMTAGDTARRVTAQAQQIHGGIGFTLDYDIQLFFRRAKHAQLNWWDTRTLEEMIASAVIDRDEAYAVADPFL